MKDPGELLVKISESLPKNPIIDELVMLVRALFEENQQLKQQVKEMKQEIRQLKDEISFLKNQPPRPKIKPSKLEMPNNKKRNQKNWKKSSKNKRLIIDREEKIELLPDQIPQGAIFKGYKKFIIQELIITKQVTKYLLAQWRKPNGKYISAKLPKKFGNNHFGPTLQQYIVYQHHANRVTQNRIKSDLQNKSIDISTGQIDAILQKAACQMKPEKEQLLTVGLKSKHIQTDDTGARHQGKNGFATVVCNDFFTYFKSTDKKSRINFLEILCGSKIEYVVTQEALNYIKAYKQAKTTINCMQKLLGKHFNRESWTEFLYKNFFGKKTCKVLTEGALIGTLITRKTITSKTILMSDGAGQFNLFRHVLCWIHIERILKKLVPINNQDRKERDLILDNFWTFYRELKTYKENRKKCSEELKQSLSIRFDEIFSFHATEIPLAKALKKIRDNKAQLLLVLDHPKIPLHNNASENDIREYVTKRKISGGTRSQNGREARDTFTSLHKTCKKLGIHFWNFLADRFTKTNKIPLLADLVNQQIKLVINDP